MLIEGFMYVCVVLGGRDSTTLYMLIEGFMHVCVMLGGGGNTTLYVLSVMCMFVPCWIGWGTCRDARCKLPVCVCCA